MDFTAFVNEIEEQHLTVYGVEVYKGGVLTHSYKDTRDEIHEIYSATKTILSIAVGIAYDRRIIDINKSVLFYLPEEKVAKMSSENRADFEKLTLHRLLTMSVKDWPFRPEGDNYLNFCLECKSSDPDAMEFNYSNVTACLMGIALSNALGEDLWEFIKREILEPLGIDRYEYGRTPEGYFYGASQMKLTVNGLSRIGMLLYNKGVYGGKRILSEEYVEMATSVQQMNREGGYGYYIWKYRDGFSINGKWGQKCYCLPKEGIMITCLAHIEEGSGSTRVAMEKYILS